MASVSKTKKNSLSHLYMLHPSGFMQNVKEFYIWNSLICSSDLEMPQNSLLTVKMTRDICSFKWIVMQTLNDNNKVKNAK